MRDPRRCTRGHLCFSQWVGTLGSLRSGGALVVLGCSLLLPSAHATEDLVALLTLAEQTDPQYRQAQANALAVAEEIPQARARLLMPSLSLSAGTQKVLQDIELARQAAVGAGGNIDFTTRNFRLTMNQPVYNHELIVAYKQADKRLKQAQFELAAARQDLIVRVAERYFEVLAANDNLTFARAEKQSLARQLEQASQRFEVGLIAITDVQEAQAGFDRAAADEIIAANDVENALEGLREVTARYHPELAMLDAEVTLTPPDPNDIEAWTQQTLAQNLQLSAATVEVEVALDEIKRERARHLPTLDIVGSHGFNSTGGRFGGSELTQSDIGLEFNLPIFEGGEVVASTREARHRHDEAVERMEQTKRSVYRETRESYLGIIARISSVKALKQAVVSSQTALDSTRAGFEVGTRTAIDVVAAERTLFGAKRDFARARYDYILDVLSLKRAAGSLEPADVAIVNSWLQGAGETSGEDG